MKKHWFKEFKRKFRIAIIHPETYEEVKRFDMSRMKFTNVVIVYTLLLIALTTCVIVFTPLRELIPGYTDVTLGRRIYRMERRADSMEVVFRHNNLYVENLKRIMNDEDLDDYSIRSFRPHITVAGDNVSMPSFFVPINGFVTNHFDSRNKHFGVDVVSSADAVIKATADGTVIFSDWSVDGGYVIGIQHSKNIISVYKHNASILCHEGDVVHAGDAIAILGNGGNLTTGPHLHFELWFRGQAINPEDYISFEGK